MVLPPGGSAARSAQRASGAEGPAGRDHGDRFAVPTAVASILDQGGSTGGDGLRVGERSGTEGQREDQGDDRGETVVSHGGGRQVSIGVGIVGCGGISRAHVQRGYRLLRENGLGHFRVCAVCDVDGRRAAGLADLVAETLGEDRPRVFTDPADLVASGAVDAVDCCTAVFAHHTVAVAALEAGIGVTVEKPFAVTVRAGQRMVEAARRTGAVLAISENVHFEPRQRIASWVLQQDRIGTPQVIVMGGTGTAGWFPDKIVADTAWRHQRMLAGAGAVLDLGSHSFDTLRTLGGEVAEVSALTRQLVGERLRRAPDGAVVERVASEVDDVALVLLTFASGAIGMFGTGWGGHGRPTGFAGGLAVQCSAGSLQYTEEGGLLSWDDGRTENAAALFQREAERGLRERFFPRGVTVGFALELHDFLEAVATHRPPENDGEQGVRNMAVAYAAIESSLLRRSVTLQEVLDGGVSAYQDPIDRHWGLL